jgi:hypothetical protein
LRNAIVQNADDRTVFEGLGFQAQRNAPAPVLSRDTVVDFVRPCRLRSRNHRHNSRQKIAFGRLAIMDR